MTLNPLITRLMRAAAAIVVLLLAVSWRLTRDALRTGIGLR